jgi:hypothetical protein
MLILVLDFSFIVAQRWKIKMAKKLLTRKELEKLIDDNHESVRFVR